MNRDFVTGMSRYSSSFRGGDSNGEHRTDRLAPCSSSIPPEGCRPAQAGRPELDGQTSPRIPWRGGISARPPARSRDRTAPFASAGLPPTENLPDQSKRRRVSLLGGPRGHCWPLRPNAFRARTTIGQTNKLAHRVHNTSPQESGNTERRPTPASGSRPSRRRARMSTIKTAVFASIKQQGFPAAMTAW